MKKYYATFGFQYSDLKSSYIEIYADSLEEAMNLAKVKYGNKVTRLYSVDDIFYKSMFPAGCIETIWSKK